MDKVYDFLVGYSWAGDWLKVAATFLLVAFATFMAIRIAWRAKCYSPFAMVFVYVTNVATSLFRALHSEAIHYAGVERAVVTTLEAMAIVGWFAMVYFFWQERWTLRVERRAKTEDEEELTA